MIELLNSRRMATIVVVLVFVCLLIVIFESMFTDDSDATKPVFNYSHTGVFINHQGEKVVFDKNISSEMQSSLRKLSDQNARTITNCWLHEKFEIVEECARCSDFEKVSKHLTACIDSGYKEMVKCPSIGNVYRPCDKQSQNFWIFESSMIILAIIGSFVVNLRQKQLDHKTLEKIQKQIAAGV